MKLLKSEIFWTWVAFATLILAIVLNPRSGHSECFDTAAKARDAHHAQHASWSNHVPHHRGEKCWFADGWRDRNNDPPQIVAAALPPVPLPPVKPPAPRPVESPQDGYAGADSVESAHAAFAGRKPVDLSPYLSTRGVTVPDDVISSPLVPVALSLWLRASREHAQTVLAHALQ